jgi:uncharacterized phage protein (TIGR02218 family)
MAGMLEGPLTSIALCWRIERSDGAGLALTSHDEKIVIGTTYFDAAPGMLPAAIQRRSGLEPNGGEIAGAITSASLHEDDLERGRWDGARVTMSAVDWQNVDAGELRLLRGGLGEVRLERGEFKAELRGTAARLEAAICPETAPECRAELGDKKCRVDLAGRSMIAIVLEVEGRSLMLDQNVSADFVWGRARFLNGANCGLVTIIVGIQGNSIELRDNARAGIEPGERIEIRHGCDKSFATCAARFANASNFRGEPHLPGNDLLTRYPGT